MKNIGKLIIFLIAFFSGGCVANAQYLYVYKEELESSDLIVLGLNSGGPISCGEYELLVTDLQSKDKLSCFNNTVEKNLEEFNLANLEEKFIVLSSFKGAIELGSEISVKNSSSKAFTLGNKYILFLKYNELEFEVRECTAFEYELLASEIQAQLNFLDFSKLLEEVFEKDAICKLKK
jgi:hypothetical protein